MKIANIVGARPNLVKIAPLLREMRGHPEIQPLLVHTGQHYDEKLSDVFFRQMGIAEPDFNLEVGSGSHAWQTAEVLKEEKPGKRVYSLHESEVAVIKKGKSHPECEFGSVVAVAINEDGLVVAHEEYQKNVSEVKTLSPLLRRVQSNTGNLPLEVCADRGFSRPFAKEERWRNRWGVKRVAIPRRGKRPHPHQQAGWFRRALRRRVKIEPVISHLKNDHRLSRCRYKGRAGDTANVVWASVAWNTKKVTFLSWLKAQKQAQSKVRLAV